MASGPELGMKITADASGLHEQLGRASNEVRTFGSAAQDTASQVEQQVNAQVRALGSSANYKRELRDCVKEVQNLTMAYRALSDEQRNGALGQAIQEQLSGAKARAAELKDAIADMNDEIKNMASDTAPFDSINQGIGLIRDTMGAYIAISGMAGTTTAEFERTIQDLAAVTKTFNAVIGITNALQKQSALMTGINTIKNWASERAKRAETAALQENTAAEVANSAATTGNTSAKAANTITTTTGKVATDAATAATVRLTVAQKAFNLVAKANPYILLASVILTVGAGLLALFNASHKATDQLKKQKQAAEELAAAKEKLAEKHRTLAAAGSDLKVKFAELAAEYGTLKTKAEKQQWIEQNKSKFNELGIEINGVKMAEDVFVHNTGAVVAAMVARAKALKMIDQAVDDMADLDKKYADMDKKFAKGSMISENGKFYRKYKGENISDEEAKKAGVRTTAQRTHRETYIDQQTGQEKHYTSKPEDYTKEEIARIEANRAREAKAVKDAVKARYDAEVKAIYDNVGNAVKAQMAADKKLYSIAGKPGTSKPTKGGGGKSKEEEKAEKGSLEDLKKQREELIKIQQKGTYKKHKTNADEVTKEIRRLDQEIADAQFVIDFNTDPAKVSLETIEDQYNRLYAQARSQKLSPEDKGHANKNLQTINQAAVNKKYSAGLDIKPAENELISLQKKADEIFAQMQNPEVQGSDMFKTLKESYDAAVEDINKKKIEMGIDTSVAEGSIDDLQSKIAALLGERNALVLDVQTDESKARIVEIDDEVKKLSEELNGDASELKISTESAHASIASMEARISELKKQLNMDVSLTMDGQKEIVQEILKIEKDIKQHKIKIGLETDPSVEQLKKMAQQAQEAMTPKKKSSFEEAVGTPKPAKNDYEGQLRQLQSLMDENDNMLSKLEDIKQKYEEMGATGEESYQKILDKMVEMKAANDELASQAKTASKQDKKEKKRAKNWDAAADAVGNFSSALGSLGTATESPELNVAGIIAQGIAELALNGTKSLAACTTPWEYIAAAVGIAATIFSVAASIHSAVGSYQTGGLIPGNSYSGDKLTARVNSGEMILNSAQQYRLWNLANGGNVGETTTSGASEVEFVLHGDTLRGVLKNTNRGLKRKGRNTDL